VLVWRRVTLGEITGQSDRYALYGTVREGCRRHRTYYFAASGRLLAIGLCVAGRREAGHMVACACLPAIHWLDSSRAGEVPRARVVIHRHVTWARRGPPVGIRCGAAR
jgi:hypothetical protein